MLDESSFQQLLAAAYVVQQHNDDVRAQNARLDTTQVLAEIAEIQARMRVEGLDITAASRLIADRLRHRTNAAGVSVGLVSDGYLDCVAESGDAARLPGSCLASHSLVATERLKNGEIFQSAGAQTDIRLDRDLCRQLGVGSLIAAPVQVFGEIAGVIEVRWNPSNAFHEQDVRCCQLMASLATGMLERKQRDQQLSPKSTSLAESSAQTPSVTSAAAEPTPLVETSVPDTWDEILREKSTVLREDKNQPSATAEKSPSETSVELPAACRLCGRAFRPDEAFCGHCSMPRVASASSEGLQSKWASLWFMQQAQDTMSHAAASPPSVTDQQPSTPVVGNGVDAVSVGNVPAPAPPRTWYVHEETRPRLWDIDARTPAVTEPTLEPTDGRWLQDAFEAVRGRVRTRDVALLVIAAVLGSVLVMAALSPAPKAGQLTRFEKLLVAMGLAEPPASVPGPAGRPDVRVWVDVHTALYYCPGSELYGKTPDGKFATQRDAQGDQFQPASNTPCP